MTYHVELEKYLWYFLASWYFYVYYKKESILKQNRIQILIILAVGCKAIDFTCEITIKTFTGVKISKNPATG